MNRKVKPKTKSVGSYEAKTPLPQLLDMVEEGQAVTITRRSRKVARLVPATDPAATQKVFSQIRALRSQIERDRSITARELVDAGRRI